MLLIKALHHLPEWAVYLTVVPIVTLIAVALPFVGCSFLRIGSNDDRSRGAIEAYKAIVASLAFLLAFTLVQAQDTVKMLDRLVSQEAAAINTIDRSLLRFGNDDFLQLRSSLRDLVKFIQSDEWPGLVDGRRSDRVEAIVDTLSRRIRTTEASTPRQQALLGDLISKLDDFTDRREELIGSAAEELPGLFWSTVGGLLLVLGVLAAFITPSRERVLTIGGITAASMLLLCLIIITDAPFAGGTMVTAAPLDRVGKLTAARQKDPPVLPR